MASESKTVVEGLKPCPFCGGAARMVTKHDPDDITWHFIQCSGCSVRTHGMWHSAGNDCPSHRAEVRDEWNRRATSLASQCGGEAAMAGEYAAWIAFYDRGDGDYADFLRQRAPSTSPVPAALDQVESSPMPQDEEERLIENAVRTAIRQFGAERFARALASPVPPTEQAGERSSTLKCIYCTRDMAAGSECTSEDQAERCEGLDAHGVDLPEGGRDACHE